MNDLSSFGAWANFYVIVGSAAAAIIGVQFVVIALIAGRDTPAKAEGIRAFSSPTVAHLAAVLSMSALMCVPWRSRHTLSGALVAGGLVGVTYGVAVIRRARRQTAYAPMWSDWLWYAAAPCGLYAGVVAGALLMWNVHYFGPFLLAGTSLGLLLIGVRNAWDTVTHIVTAGAAGAAGERAGHDADT